MKSLGEKLFDACVTVAPNRWYRWADVPPSDQANYDRAAVRFCVLLSDAQQWVGIESAPRDNTPILVCVAGTDWWPRSAWWSTRYKRWVINERDDGCTHLTVEPTHWQELPAAAPALADLIAALETAA